MTRAIPGLYTERPLDPFAQFKRSGTGLWVPPALESGRWRYGPKPLHIDLFSGAGGFGCGVVQAGFRTVAATDHWELAALTYMYNLGSYPAEFHWIEPADEARMEKALHAEMAYEAKNGRPMWRSGAGWISHMEPPPEDAGAHLADDPEAREWFKQVYYPPGPGAQDGCPHFWLGDVRKLSGFDMLRTLGLERGEVDLVTGGPPCQGFSMAGQRDVMDPRNSLVFEFSRLCREIQPRAFVMENVPGIASMVTPQGVPVLDALSMEMEDGGFGAWEAIKRSLLLSSGAGVAIKRGKKNAPTEAAEYDEEEDEPAERQLEMAL